ncbi:hypothetical protein [Streptomyces sp. NRRL S-237]|uniref:hypothetical protein n=1 Tax=Streptomyces sp. NRRL S-237 TaxID=1463895 RepID=UPI0004C624DD|nr:hypothetical protein [Streptomyces sp. NRRL S-237]
MADQSGWRRCKKCRALFFDGFEHSGVCAATPNHAGEHTPETGSFRLTHDAPEIDLFFNMQREWRNCWKCQVLYYGPTNGPCPGPDSPQTIDGVHYGGQSIGGAFPDDTFNFYLLMNFGAGGGQVDNWRACWKCLSLIYDKPADTGDCPAGGQHENHGNEAGVANFTLAIDG